MESTQALNLNWMSRDAESRKRDLFGQAWGTVVGNYLWYVLDGVDSFVGTETQEIVSRFFVSGHATFGDVELHRSAILPGNLTLLRLRGRLWTFPGFMFRGEYRPLYQIGHANDPPDSGAINFHHFWNTGERMSPQPAG